MGRFAVDVDVVGIQVAGFDGINDAAGGTAAVDDASAAVNSGAGAGGGGAGWVVMVDLDTNRGLECLMVVLPTNSALAPAVTAAIAAAAAAAGSDGGDGDGGGGYVPRLAAALQACAPTLVGLELLTKLGEKTGVRGA